MSCRERTTDMLLSRETTVQLNTTDAALVRDMCHAAYKVWNICNYERKHYDTLGLEKFPGHHDQTKSHKDDYWYRRLPSQTAQYVIHDLDGAWKSYFALLASDKASVVNPHPPKYKQEPMSIVYIQKGIRHAAGSAACRLSLALSVRKEMKEKEGVRAYHICLENELFRHTDDIRTIRIFPPDDKGTCRIILVHEVPDTEPVPDSGHYLGIDLGLHNLMTCYDNHGKCFIVGRQYLSICRLYDKEISRVQSQWARTQAAAGVEYPKISKHVQQLYGKKNHAVKDYLHKVTKWIVDYCKENHISTVVIGDITSIRKDNDKGRVTNQKLHGLPYAKLYLMLEYKLQMEGITLVKQNEAYSSQCPPDSPQVSWIYAQPQEREQRGLFVHGGTVYNADAVGAYNILRLWTKKNMTDLKCLSCPVVIKVAV